MTININKIPVELSAEHITISDLLKIRDIKRGGTAIALNDKIVKHELWDSTILKDGDRLTVISAAFGG